jgi:hypothetical protein
VLSRQHVLREEKTLAILTLSDVKAKDLTLFSVISAGNLFLPLPMP